jgi:hypothetical protein
MTRAIPGYPRGGPLGVYTDAARRAHEIVNTHLMVDPEGNRGRWVALRLSDGGSDGVVYDDVAAAADHQLHYQQCMYVRIPWGGLPVAEAETLLTYHRRVYDAGNRPPYLEGYSPIIPNAKELLT